MELWVGHAKKASICHYCVEAIRKDEAVMQGRSRKRRGRPWPPVIRWHLDCWMESSREYLRAQDHARIAGPKSLGRPRVVDPATGEPLSEESRELRARLVRRFNMLAFRRGRLVNDLAQLGSLDGPKLVRIRSLTTKMQECLVGVAEFGAVPSNWHGILSMGNTNVYGSEADFVHSDEGVYPPGVA